MRRISEEFRRRLGVRIHGCHVQVGYGETPTNEIAACFLQFSFQNGGGLAQHFHSFVRFDRLAFGFWLQRTVIENLQRMAFDFRDSPEAPHRHQPVFFDVFRRERAAMPFREIEVDRE